MVIRDKDKEYITPMAGVQRKTLAVGQKGMLTKFALAAGAQLPRHSHPQEQIGYLIAGEMTMTIGNQEYQLSAGDSWAIPGGVEHSVIVVKPVEAIEVFVPIREDYLD